MTIYIVTTPNSDGTQMQHAVTTDAAPAVVPGQGLTFTLAGVIQAPSPFPQWCSCVEQP